MFAKGKQLRHLTLLAAAFVLLFAFQNCTSPVDFEKKSDKLQSRGNENGYSGKVFVHVGECESGQLSIRSRIVLNEAGNSGLQTRRDCEVEYRIVTDFEIQSNGLLTHEGQHYTEQNASTSTVADAHEKLLGAFLSALSTSALQRNLSASELQSLETRFKSGQATCPSLISETIRSAESLQLQEPLVDTSRAEFIFHASGGRPPSAVELSEWSNAGLRCAPPTAVGGSPASDSIVLNASFESGLSGWLARGPAILINSGHLSGVASVQVSGAAGGVEQEVVSRLQIGGTYHLTALAKIGATEEPAWVGVKFFNSTGTVLQESMVQINTLQFSRFTVDLRVPQGTTSAVAFGWKSAGYGSTAAFDDFELVSTANWEPVLLRIQTAPQTQEQCRAYGLE